MQSCKHQAGCQHAAALSYQLDRDARATAPKWMQDANSKEKKKNRHKASQPNPRKAVEKNPIHPRKYFNQIRELIYVIKKKNGSLYLQFWRCYWIQPDIAFNFLTEKKKKIRASLSQLPQSPLEKGLNYHHSHTKENYPAS